MVEGLMETGLKFIKRRKYTKDIVKSGKKNQKYWDLFPSRVEG